MYSNGLRLTNSSPFSPAEWSEAVNLLLKAFGAYGCYEGRVLPAPRRQRCRSDRRLEAVVLHVAQWYQCERLVYAKRVRT